MNEKGKNRKEWIKTAAIIFLSVMLVLTFFSNTIMNYSLPEVAAQYIQSGSITAQIRGTGIVESGDPYSVKVGAVRKVESIEVNVGDQVQKGDILMYLSYEDSEALKMAKEELEAAQMAYEMAVITGEVDVSVMKNAGETLSIETYKNKIMNLKNAISSAEKEVEEKQKKVDELAQWGNALSTQISVTPSNNADTSAEKKNLDDLQQKLESSKLELEVAENKLAEIERTLEQLGVAEGDPAYDELIQQKADVQVTINTCKTNCASLEVEVKKAQNALDSKIASGDTSAIIANLTNQKAQNDVNLFHAQNELTEKQKILAEKEKDLATYVKNTSDAINLGNLYKNVESAMAKVEKLEQEVVGSEVKAPLAGTISEILVRSGLDTPADGIVVTMQPEGEGYTMSFSVTNEQARKVSVGETADLVNNWRYDDLQVVLTRIMPDTSDPGQKKKLVFTVTGESVVAGQSLNVSIGEKSANYEMIVPNSAVREDNNGKFILIVESKNTPLGNRYKAVRMDVEVLASDDTKSAVSGAMYSYDFVITTSNKPVEAGQYVRLSEN